MLPDASSEVEVPNSEPWDMCEFRRVHNVLSALSNHRSTQKQSMDCIRRHLEIQRTWKNILPSGRSKNPVTSCRVHRKYVSIARRGDATSGLDYSGKLDHLATDAELASMLVSISQAYRSIARMQAL